MSTKAKVTVFLPTTIHMNRCKYMMRYRVVKIVNHQTFLGNCPPTPPLSQH